MYLPLRMNGNYIVAMEEMSVIGMDLHSDVFFI